MPGWFVWVSRSSFSCWRTSVQTTEGGKTNSNVMPRRHKTQAQSKTGWCKRSSHNCDMRMVHRALSFTASQKRQELIQAAFGVCLVEREAVSKKRNFDGKSAQDTCTTCQMFSWQIAFQRDGGTDLIHQHSPFLLHRWLVYSGRQSEWCRPGIDPLQYYAAQKCSHALLHDVAATIIVCVLNKNL